MASSSFSLVLLRLLLLAGILSSGAAVRAVSARPALSMRTTPTVGDVVGALETAGEYSRWAAALAVAYLSSLPPNATIFAPSDLAFTAAVPQPMPSSELVLYHISPETLPFCRLLKLRTGDHIPTLLTGAYIPVTGNLSLASATVTHPEIFSVGSLVVHGVSGILSPTPSNSPADLAAETSLAVPNATPPELAYMVTMFIALSVVLVWASWPYRAYLLQFCLLILIQDATERVQHYWF